MGFWRLFFKKKADEVIKEAAILEAAAAGEAVAEAEEEKELLTERQYINDIRKKWFWIQTFYDKKSKLLNLIKIGTTATYGFITSYKRLNATRKRVWRTLTKGGWRLAKHGVAKAIEPAAKAMFTGVGDPKTKQGLNALSVELSQIDAKLNIEVAKDNPKIKNADKLITTLDQQITELNNLKGMLDDYITLLNKQKKNAQTVIDDAKKEHDQLIAAQVKLREERRSLEEEAGIRRAA